MGLTAILCILFWHQPPYWVMAILLFAFGFSATSQVLTFGLVIDNQHDEVLGTAIGFTNMAVIAGGVILQPLVGSILEHLWKKTPLWVNQVPVYSFVQYQHALLVIPVCFIAGLGIAGFAIKETHAKRKHPPEIPHNIIPGHE
jgi:MFS family permease